MFGSRVKQARKDAGISQEDLAEELHVDVTQIYRWENDKTEPSGSVVAKIATCLGVSTDYLLGLTSDPTPHDLAGNALNAKERIALQAWRSGKALKAIRVIAGEE